MTTRLARLWIALCCLFVSLVVFGCHHKDSIAKLVKADGPVERQAGTGAWSSAPVGTAFFLGDAARTADRGAELKLAAAAIVMQPHTVLRFGTDKAGNRIRVELGAIDLSGSGTYQLEIGDAVRTIALGTNGAVRITAKGTNDATFELTLGEAKLSGLNGESIDLTLGKSMDFSLELSAPARDAGVTPPPPTAGDAAPPPVDAPPAPIDAPAAPTIPTIALAVTGKNADFEDVGAAKWAPVPPGTTSLPPGAKLRLGAGTTAKLTGKDTTLELAGGSRLITGDAGQFTLEAGTGRVTVPANATAEVGVPGGTVTIKGIGGAAGETKIEVTGHDTKVADLRGAEKITAATGGTTLDMNRGESASLERNGTIHPTEAIPGYYDFKIDAGDTVTIHDPRPPTAVSFSFAGKCPAGGVVEVDRDSRFRTAKISAGKDAANIYVSGGTYSYRLRCTQGDTEGAAVASGRVAVVRDDGNRPLPKAQTTNAIDADGRRYHITYQSLIPSMEITFSGPGSAFKLHLAQGGKEQTFDSAKPVVNVPGKSLREGEYTYWFDHDGVKQDKVSTLTIDFDQNAAQVYIEAPVNGAAWAPPIEVRGAALAGWSASVDGVPLPLDRARRFTAKVDAPSGHALAIRLAHDKLGVHYYLRRQK